MVIGLSKAIQVPHDADSLRLWTEDLLFVIDPDKNWGLEDFYPRLYPQNSAVLETSQMSMSQGWKARTWTPVPPSTPSLGNFYPSKTGVKFLVKREGIT